METEAVIVQEPVPKKISGKEALVEVVASPSSVEIDKVKLSTFVDDEINNNIQGEADGSETECEKGEATKNIVKEKAKDELESFNKNTENAEISDMKSNKVDITEKKEELNVENLETRKSPEEEKGIGNISTAYGETGELKEEKDETDTLRNTLNETAPLVQTETSGVEAEPKEKEETITDLPIPNTCHKPESLNQRENAEPTESTKNSDGAEQNEILVTETKETKTVISSHEVRPSDKAEQHTEPCILEIKDESHGREEYVEIESVQEESSENLLVGESEDNEAEKAIVNKNQFEETKVDQVHGTQVMEEHRGLDVESVDKPSLESPSEQLDENIEENQHQKGQEESNQVETITEDINAKEEEKVQKIHDTHTSLPSYSQKQEHGPVAQVDKTQDKDAEPMGDDSETSLEVSEKKYQELMLEQVGEVFEEETREVEETRAERIPSSETETVAEEKNFLIHDEETTADESESLKDITEEVQESARVNEANNESKVSLQVKEEIDQSSKDTEEHEHMLVRDMPQDETIVNGASVVQESAMFKTLEIKQDTETSLDLKEDKEQEASSPDVQVELGEHTKLETSERHVIEEIVGVKLRETIQEERHDILLDVPSGELEKYQDNEPETVLVAEKESTVSVEGDETKHDQTVLDAESVDEMQNLTLQPPSVLSGETTTTLDEKIRYKPEEDVTLRQEDQEESSHGLDTKEESVLIPESSEPEEKSVAAPQVEACLPNEQEKERKLQKEQTEKHEQTTNEEVPHDYQSLVDDVLKVSSASPSEELEGETIIHDIKGNGEEQVAEKIHKSLEFVETTKPHSSLPTSSEEKPHGVVAKDDNIEDQKEEAEQTHEKSLEIVETTDLSLSLEASKSDETEYEEQKPKQAREILEEDITHKKEEVQESPTVIKTTTIQEEDIGSKPSPYHDEEIDKVSKDTKEHEHSLVRDMPQVDTLVTEAEIVDTSTVQEFSILRTLETNIEEAKAVCSEKGGDQEALETKQNTETRLDVKEETKTVISLDEVRSSDVQVEEFGGHGKSCSLEMEDESKGREKYVDVKSNETVQDESNGEKDLLDVPSVESEKHQDNEPETILVTKTESLVADETTHEKAVLDDETSGNACNKQEDIGKLESLNPEDSIEDKSQEVSETVKATKAITDQTPKQLEEIHKAETMEAHKLHIADQILPVESQPDKTPSLVSEIDGEILEEEIKEAHKVEATSDQNLPVETSQPDKTSSSVSEIDRKILEEEIKEAHMVEATSDQNLHVETLEARQTPTSEEIQKEETTEAHTLQDEEILPTKIIPRESSDGALVSMLASAKEEGNCASDIRETKEQSVSPEVEEIVGLTKPKEPEDKHVETPTSLIISDKTDNEILIAEAENGHQNIIETEARVALGSSDISKTSENVCIKLEEFGNSEAPKQEEPKEEKKQETAAAIEFMGDHLVETSQADQTLPSELVSGLDEQTPRQVEEIHEEETKEEHKFEATGDQSLPVETSKSYQTSSSDLASGLDKQTPNKVEEIHEEEETEAHKLLVVSDQISLVETSQDDQILEKVEEIHEEQTKEAHTFQEEETFLTGNIPRESAPTSILATAEDEPVTLHEHNAPKNACLEKEELNDLETIQHGAITEDQCPDYHAGEAEHDDETSSTLPVVEILKGLQTTLETDREIKPANEEKTEGDAEVYSNGKDYASKIIEANMLQEVESGKIEKIQEENDLLPKEEVNLQEKVDIEEKLQEETWEISENKEEIPEVLPVEKILMASSHLPFEEVEHFISAEKQEEGESREDFNTSIPKKISLQEEHPRDFEEKVETRETVEEEEQTVDIKEKKMSEEVQDEKLSATKDIKETYSSQVKKDKEDASELGSVQDFVSPPDVAKEKETHSVLGSEEEINEVVTSANKITELSSKAEKEPYEEHFEPQAVSCDTKSNADTVDQPKDSESVQLKDQPMDFDKETTVQEQKQNDLAYVQEDFGTNVKREVGDALDSVVAELVEEKREVEYAKTELEDVKNGVEQPRSIAEVIHEADLNKVAEAKQDPIAISEGNKIKDEENKNVCEEIDQEESKKTDTITAFTPEEEETNVKNNTEEKLKQEDEVPNQQKREIAQENLKIAEELQEKEEETDNTKDSFSQVKEAEPTVKEPARKSLSDLIHKVKETNKIEDKTEEEEGEIGDEHKDDKTSPDSIVMVDAKDTVHVIKTQHKKSQGILSGVGSKVKHSISKVKKVLTGKSSHTTKPSSPK